MKSENIYANGVAETIILKTFFPFAIVMTVIILGAKLSGVYLSGNAAFDRPIEQIVNLLSIASIGLMFLYGIGLVSKTMEVPKIKLNVKWTVAKIFMAIIIMMSSLFFVMRTINATAAEINSNHNTAVSTILFKQARHIKDAAVIEDSKGCLWGLTDVNGQLISIKYTEKDGKKQLCRN
jgi:hypothetical protein